jgi:hypothetical protein
MAVLVLGGHRRIRAATFATAVDRVDPCMRCDTTEFVASVSASNMMPKKHFNTHEGEEYTVCDHKLHCQGRMMYTNVLPDR